MAGRQIETYHIPGAFQSMFLDGRVAINGESAFDPVGDALQNLLTGNIQNAAASLCRRDTAARRLR